MFGIRENSKPIRSRQTGSVDPPQHGFGWSSLRLGPDQLATVAADDELFFCLKNNGFLNIINSSNPLCMIL
jgi:hypothetical protein